MAMKNVFQNNLLNRLRISVVSNPESGNKPFPENLPDSGFYTSPLSAQKLKILNNLVGHSPLVVIVGERGSGKTTMMRRMMAEGSRDWQSVRIRLKTRQPQATTHFQGLQNREVYMSREGNTPSMIIDDAHELSIAELGAVMRKAHPKKGASSLQTIVLFSEPSIRHHLDAISEWLPPNAVIDKIDITPLTESQTSEYLAQQFQCAGGSGKPPFSRSQLRAIYESSGGLPGWINVQAVKMLKSMTAGGRYLKKPLLEPLRLAFSR